MLADPATGACCDGVTPRGRNENCGAESILAYHLGHYSMKALLQAAEARQPLDRPPVSRSGTSALMA